jgi:hypothetical protein
MNLLDGKGTKFHPSQSVVGLYLFLIAVALITTNLGLYLHSRSLEAQFRRSSPEGRPWLWPEDATGFFLIVWLLILVVDIFVIFKMRMTTYKVPTIAVSIVAVTALIANSLCLIMEALAF